LVLSVFENDVCRSIWSYHF